MIRSPLTTLVLSAGVVVAAKAQEGPLSVRYISATSVYVSGGRAAGLRVGDRLRVGGAAQPAAELEVVFLAEQSASCRIVHQARPIEPGAPVTRIGRSALPAGVAKAPAPATSAAPPSPPPMVATVPPTTPPASARPWARANGGVSFGWSRFWDAAAVARDSDQKTGRLDVSLRELAEQPLTLRLRARTRQDERLWDVAPWLPRRQRQDRLYELSLAYDPPEGDLYAQAGRLGSNPFTGLGYLDGVLAGYRVAGPLQLGGFFGRNAELTKLALASSGRKYGAFLRLASARTHGSSELTLAGVREFGEGDLSREYLAMEGSLTTGGWWLYQRAEVDLNRGWRREVAGRSYQLSDLSVSATYRASSRGSLSLSYDAGRNYHTHRTRTLPEALFDDLLRQGLRARADWRTAGGSGVWAMAGVRVRETDLEQAYSFTAGARHPRVLGLAVDADASVFTNLLTEGVMGNARLSRSWAAGHQASVAYGLSRSRLRALEGDRSTQWLRATAYAQLPSRVFLNGELEYARGDDLQGQRGGLEIGWRF